MAALTTHTLVDAGTAPTFGAASTSDTAAVGNGRSTFVVYKNGSGSPVNVTVVAPGTNEYGEPNPDKVVAVAAGAERWIPLRRAYADPETGRATITMADATSVTVAVVKLV